MLRNLQREITLLQKTIDILVVLAAWGGSFYLRFKSFSPSYLWYFKYAVLLIIFQFYFSRKLGLYESQRLKNVGSELFAVLKINTTVIVCFVLSVYFLSPEKISRSVLISYAVLSTSMLVLEKFLVRTFLRRQRARGLNLRHVLLIGNGAQIIDYVKVLRNNPEIGLRVKAWYGSNGLAHQYGFSDLDSLSVREIKELGIDYIVIGYCLKDFALVDEALKIFCHELLNITILPDLSHALIGHEVSDFAGIPVISINQPRFSSISILLKRSFDILFSLIGLVILSPVFLLISLGVKLSSPGPIFFGQKRVGLDEGEFLMWKFRSMKLTSEGSGGTGWTTKDDPRRTAFGTFIRKTSLDELPQLWNVLIGDMSLVGPRPEQPYFVEKFRNEFPSYMLRHKMKAGMTGWAQVNGWRGDTSIASRVECDIWYIKNWSIWLDIAIIFMTLWRGLINKNAY